jgi:hypothetical protein
MLRLKELIEELKLVAGDSEMDTMLIEVIETLAEKEPEGVQAELKEAFEKIGELEGRLSNFPDIASLVGELKKQNLRTVELISKMGVSLETSGIEKAIEGLKSDKEEKALEKIGKILEKISERKSKDYTKQLEDIATALQKGAGWEFDVVERDMRGGLKKVIAKII